MDNEDCAPLITACYEDDGTGGSPKIQGFYDKHETLNPDKEPSMDLGSMSNEPNRTSHVYKPPNVEEDLPSIEKYITCQICQTTISLKSFKARVVKCPRCQEGNPIKEPPPGKKYIRCACNCLLVCNSTARAVICPRDGCNHRTQLINPPPSPKFIQQVDKVPSFCCPNCLFTIKLTLPRRQFILCSQCGNRVTTLTKSERSLLLLRYLGFFIVLVLLLSTGILILEMVPGNVWEPLLFCGCSFGIGSACLIYKLIPLCNSTPFL